jgi:hypothetical protein
MARQLTNSVPHPIFQEPVFNDPGVLGNPAGFQQPHPSDNDVYNKIQDLLTKDVVGLEKSRMPPGEVFKLEAALGPRGSDIVDQIARSGGIVFHALGDSGASKSRQYPKEIHVADQLTTDSNSADVSDRPAFLFHLGDLVYDFGESKYYYDEFYEPFRNYPAPIFAIPGNHDSFIVPDTPAGSEPLTIFSRNFCSESLMITAEAGSLHRTAMTQPGVYFTLDAPFVRVIGLFSNSLEDPGVISSEKGKWPAVPDFQLEFLAAQLKRIKDEKYQGAVLLASHHPAFSYEPQNPSGARGNHGSSPAMLRQIDEICLDVGFYPHALLSGHAHNYQRYTRELTFLGQEIDVPFVVCGDGGHAADLLVRSRRGQPSLEPVNGSRVDRNYGYLRISANKDQLRIGFHQVTNQSILQSRYDLVTVDLKSHRMVAN